MKSYLKLMLVAVAVSVINACETLFSRNPRRVAFANTYEELVKTHESSIPRLAEAAITTRHLLYKKGTANTEILECAAAYEPLGVVDNDDVEAGDTVDLELLGRGRTKKLVASEAITVGERVYTAAGGKVQDEPAVEGTYYLVGVALSAAAADGDLIEVETCTPIKVVVIAAMTSTDGTMAAAADDAATKAEGEKIGDDVRAIAAALATPALVKVLV